MADVKMLPEAQEQFLDLPTDIKVRVRKMLVRLAKFPAVSGAKPLRKDLAG